LDLSNTTKCDPMIVVINSCSATVLGVTKFITITAMILVTLCWGA
jgi:hypothetical protein